MKLVAIYSVFDGIEFLRGAMKSIENCVDGFIIIYQKTSNHGEVDGTVMDQVMKSVSEFENICLMPFEPNLRLPDKKNELNKHNQSIELAKAMGFSHFIIGAVDHYFDELEFQRAKEKAEDFDLTLTGMFTYFKKPTWQLTPIETYLMPFICKLYPETKFVEPVWKLPYVVDPSVRINTTAKHYLFAQDEIMMHHFSMVRADVAKKIRNAAGHKRWGNKINNYLHEAEHYSIEQNKGIEYFHGRTVVEVPNQFNIHL
jgi:hypothetical protein